MMNRRNFFGTVGATIAAAVLGRQIEPSAVNMGNLNSRSIGADDLHVRTFIADEVRTGGEPELWMVGQALLESDLIMPGLGGHIVATCTPAYGPFKLGDYLCVRFLDGKASPSVVTAWFRVTELVDIAERDNTLRTIIVGLEHVHGGDAGMTIPRESAIVNFGQADAPWITLESLGIKVWQVA